MNSEMVLSVVQNELKKSQLQNLLESNAQMESELDGWRAELEKLVSPST